MKEKDSTIKGWQRILLLIIPYFFIVVLFQFIGQLIINGGVIHDIAIPQTLLQHLIVSFFDLLGTLLILYLFVRVVDDEPFVNIGFQITNRLKDNIIGLFLGLIIMSLAYIILIHTGDIIYIETKFNLESIVLSIGLFITVALAEEILFRGYILRNLMYSFNKYVALLLSSTLFSLMHSANPNMDWFSFLNLFLAGILLGISYINTKNLWFPIALHFSWNFFQTLFGFNVSGQDLYSLIEFKIKEKNIFNGGYFGFEGSIFSIIIQVMIITAIVIYYQNKKTKS
jgi:membrane protease YdiL (CAAX protease family)